MAITAALQAATVGSQAMHVKVTGRDFASRLNLEMLPSASGASRRREVWGGREETSDPRVRGRYRNAFDVWEYRDGRIHFTDVVYTLTNARGAWRGTSFGAKGADGSHYFLGAMYGTGAYEGLLYRLVVHDKASGSAGSHLFEIDGWIERAGAPVATVETGERHDRVTGRSTPHQLLPSGGVRAGVEKTSDPRTTGRYTGTMRLIAYPEGRMHFWGTYTLETSLGTWKGPWHGVVTKDGRYMQFVDATGTGDLAGLRYRHVDTGTMPRPGKKTTVLAVNGWIESVR